MIIFEGHLYEESFRYEDKIALYSDVIRKIIYKATADKILRHNKKYLITDLAKRYSDQVPEDLFGLGVKFANTDSYFYSDNTKSIILPDRILTSELTKKDSIGISHELEHYFQFKNGKFKDEGTYTNMKNKDSDISYNNDSNEINARLSQISTYLKNANRFREEVSGYDFGPFVEEVLTKILYLDNPDSYLDDVLSEDNRNKVLEYLYLMWKKLKTN